MGERSFAKESAVCRNIYRKVATSTHLLFQVCTSNSLTMLALALNGIQCTGNLGTKNNTSGVGESRLDSMGLWYSLMMSGSSHHSLKLDILFDNFCNICLLFQPISSIWGDWFCFLQHAQLLAQCLHIACAQKHLSREWILITSLNTYYLFQLGWPVLVVWMDFFKLFSFLVWHRTVHLSFLSE